MVPVTAPSVAVMSLSDPCLRPPRIRLTSLRTLARHAHSSHLYRVPARHNSNCNLYSSIGLIPNSHKGQLRHRQRPLHQFVKAPMLTQNQMLPPSLTHTNH